MKFFIAVLMLLPSLASASIDIGGGLTSITSGRYIPGINASYTGSDWIFSATSVGYQSTSYYGSNYSMSAMKRWDPGTFFWGKLTTGFGLGVGYSMRGYKSNPATISNSSDFIFGPAFRISWYFAGPVYLNIQTVFGLGLASLSLVGMDITLFSIGVSL